MISSTYFAAGRCTLIFECWLVIDMQYFFSYFGVGLYIEFGVSVSHNKERIKKGGERGGAIRTAIRGQYVADYSSGLHGSAFCE